MSTNHVDDNRKAAQCKVRGWLLAACGLILAGSLQSTKAGAAETPGNGERDFDFNIGVWKTHIRRIPNPFVTPSESVELNGTVTVRKVWDGRAQLEEIEADGPRGHWEGLTLFLYNPAAHQWSQSFVDSSSGEYGGGLIGGFKDGRGELFSSDTFKGRSILVRGTWSEITPDSHRFEEAYSDDGGKTWLPAFIANLTRIAREAPTAKLDGALREGSHDFDFDLGKWKTHSSRLLHPLTGSKEWTETDGVTMVSPIWGGRANLAEFKANGPAGPLELLSLRWFNPAARQWYLDFATPGVGTLGIPNIGEFKNGRGDFYDQETINGKSIWVRFSIWSTAADTAQSEQAFSDDGGKTWEVNWINRYTRDRS